MFERPPVATMLRRGLRRRCARCGERLPFDGWFKLGERCVRCGYRFAREEGFFTGTYLVNYAMVAVLLVTEVMAYLAVSVIGDHSAPLLPWMAGGAVIAVVVPVLTYPFAASLWAAMDLAMRPLEPVEEAEAALHART